MNLVLDDAEEVNVKKKTRKVLGELPAPPSSVLLQLEFRVAALLRRCGTLEVSASAGRGQTDGLLSLTTRREDPAEGGKHHAHARSEGVNVRVGRGEASGRRRRRRGSPKEICGERSRPFDVVSAWRAAVHAGPPVGHDGSRDDARWRRRASGIGPS